MIPNLSERETAALTDFLYFLRESNIPRLDERNLYTDTKSFRTIPAFLKITFTSLVDKSVLSYYQDNGTAYYELGIYYADELWNLAEFLFSDSSALKSNDNQQSIPASDRFVPIDHNSIEIRETVATLDKILDRLDTSNELKADKEQRQAIRKEVSALREALEQSVIRIVSIWTATKNSGVLSWLSQHGSDAILNALAVEAVGHLLKIIGMN